MTADASVVVPALSRWHRHYEAAAEALDGVAALPAHVLVESYAVLTRLPGGLAVAPEAAGAGPATTVWSPSRLGPTTRSC